MRKPKLKVSVTVEGEIRTLIIPEELWANSREAMIHFAGGGDIEVRPYSSHDYNKYTGNAQTLSSAYHYRIFVKKPAMGEIWYCSDTEEFLLIASRGVFTGMLDGYTHGDSYDGAVFFAGSVADLIFEGNKPPRLKGVV